MKRLLLLTFLLAGLTSAQAVQDPCLPPKPANEDHLVFQLTPFLAEHEAAELDAKLVRFARETSNRIAVLVVDSLCGYPASDFAFLVGEQWGIGGKARNNGVLVLVKPTGTPGERKVFIATGYGLEGAIPDAICRRVVDEEIIPRFKQQDFFGGLDAGTNTLMALARGEINVAEYGHDSMPLSAVIFVVLVVLMIAAGVLMALGRVRTYARTNDIDFWTAWWLLSQATRSHRGQWGGFTGRGGGWGGGGGGFGGFGGGGFGGGGAGGSW